MAALTCVLAILTMASVEANLCQPCATTAQPLNSAPHVCNCPNQPILNVTCNCACDCSTSQNPPANNADDICFNPPSNNNYTEAYPLTLQQITAAPFMSSVNFPLVTRNWDSVCLTMFKLTTTLYVQFFTVTLLDGTVVPPDVFLLSDEVNKPGRYVGVRNTIDARPEVVYRTALGATTISKYNFLGFSSFVALISCPYINQGNLIYDTTSVYPTTIPLTVRRQAASQLLNTSNVRQLAYKNVASCVTRLNGIPCIKIQNTSSAKQISWPPPN